MESFDRQPHLHAERLHLRPMQASDWAGLHAVARDPLLWAQHPAPTRWQEPVFRAYFEQGLASGGALVAIDPADGRIIGASRYGFDRADEDEVEIGSTFLARGYWGGETNAVLKWLMVGHALRHLQRTIFVVGENNLRSRRALQKIGAELTARSIDAPQGRHVVYAIDRGAFAAGPLMRLQQQAVPQPR
jgi:RimJ/RimL family protein N-acetyltransferase